MHNRTAVLAALLAASAASAASPPLCSFSSDAGTDGGLTGPPSGEVSVTILSMKLNSDMEGEDDYIPGYDDRADVAGRVTINATGTPESFKLPEISENDFPHWTHDNVFVSKPATPGQPVHISIALWDSDTAYDDTIDVSPNASHDTLELDLDTCSLMLSGDFAGSAQGVVEVKSGTGSNQGTLRFQVGMSDGRALSTAGDVVLTAFDLVQVLPNAGRMVGGKPLVGLVTVANNTPSPQPVSIRFQVFNDNGVQIYDGTESMGGALQAGEVRSKYLATAAPVIPPDPECKPAKLRAVATLVLAPGAETRGDPKTACWLINNSSTIRSWDLVSTRPVSLLWVRTGRLLTAADLASPSELATMKKWALPYIRGLYPTATVNSSEMTVPFVPPITGVVLDLFVDLLAGVGIPADGAIPYAITYELAAEASLLGVDRLMGTLPRDFFKTTLYGLWDGTTGLSLGEWHPHAVIFEVAQAPSNAPAMTLPAHELGHTFGLSTDPTIKSWACSLSGDLGVIACGIGGGFDEYHSSSHPNGVDTWGYWVPQGGGSPSFTGEQCNSNCLMGPSFQNAHSAWRPISSGGGAQWVDAADYDQLVDRLTRCKAGAAGTPGGSSLYLSGLIAGADKAVLGWTFAYPASTRGLDFADRPSQTPTLFAVQMLDAKGARLSESELPLDWNHPETEWPVQATFFGGHVAMPGGTTAFQIVNRKTGKVLADRKISKSAPVVSTPKPSIFYKNKTPVLSASWSATDADGDALTHFVQLSPDRGVTWWPVGHALTKGTFTVDLTDAAPGTYLLRVMTSDGANLGSAQTSFSF
ncbi:MAG: hypothetical protein IPJ65_39225 [Archangiaceae bacterium]|nr:hypothetical protein [Archangiaceae bacterium]